MNKKSTQILIIVIAAVIAVGIIGYSVWQQQNKEKEANSTDGLAVYTENVQDTEGYKTFTEFTGVTFKYPSNYVSVGKSTNPIYMDPEVSGASVNILQSTIPSAYTFEGYVQASIPGIKSQMTISGEVNTEYINLNGRKAAKLDYVAVGSTGNVKITQLLIEKDGKAYILTLGSLEKDAEAVKTKFNNIIKSFK